MFAKTYGFDLKDYILRVVRINNQIYFVSNDIARILGYSTANNVTNYVNSKIHHIPPKAKHNPKFAKLFSNPNYAYPKGISVLNSIQLEKALDKIIHSRKHSTKRTKRASKLNLQITNITVALKPLNCVLHDIKDNQPKEITKTKPTKSNQTAQRPKHHTSVASKPKAKVDTSKHPVFRFKYINPPMHYLIRAVKLNHKLYFVGTDIMRAVDYRKPMMSLNDHVAKNNQLTILNHKVYKSDPKYKIYDLPKLFQCRKVTDYFLILISAKCALNVLDYINNHVANPNCPSKFAVNAGRLHQWLVYKVIPKIDKDFKPNQFTKPNVTDNKTKHLASSVTFNGMLKLLKNHQINKIHGLKLNQFDLIRVLVWYGLVKSTTLHVPTDTAMRLKLITDTHRKVRITPRLQNILITDLE